MRGLEIEAQVGENPYRFGFVGATDGHIGMSSVEERNFFGKIATDSLLSQPSATGRSRLPMEAASAVLAYL